MWIVVVIFFLGGQPADSKILAAQTQKDCVEGRAAVQLRLKAENLTAWVSECQEVSVPKFQKDRDS